MKLEIKNPLNVCNQSEKVELNLDVEVVPKVKMKIRDNRILGISLYSVVNIRTKIGNYDIDVISYSPIADTIERLKELTEAEINSMIKNFEIIEEYLNKCFDFRAEYA